LSIKILETDELPRDVISRDFVGDDHGGIGACVLFVGANTGDGPRLHRHPYVEILIVLEGVSTLNDGVSETEVGPGHMAVVDAGQAHGFVNRGQSVLRQIDIHMSPRFITEWLE